VYLHQLGDGGALLPDGHVDAEERLGLVALVVDELLVDDGVDGHGRLAGLAIADDQLTLRTGGGANVSSWSRVSRFVFHEYIFIANESAFSYSR